MALREDTGANVKHPIEARHRKLRPGVLGWVLGILLTALAVILFSRPMTPTSLGRRLYMGNYLVSLHRAQLALRDKCIFDEDGDGKAEFTTLANILAMADQLGWSQVSEDMTELRSEAGEGKVHEFYLVKVYAPEDVSLREEAWCAVAWPAKYDRSTKYTIAAATPYVGKRLRSDGIVYAWTQDRRYSGWGKGPTLEDVFVGEPFKSNLRWRK